MLCWKVNQGYSWITLKIPPGSIIRSSDGRPTQCQKIQIARRSSTSPSTGKADKTAASSGRSLSSLATFLSPGESLEHQTRRGTISSAWILIEFLYLMMIILKVGGHTQFLQLDQSTVCKPLIPRELSFYLNAPADIRTFTPQCKGKKETHTQSLTHLIS